MDQGKLDVFASVGVAFLIFYLLSEVTDGIGENALSEVFIHVLASPSLSLYQVSRNIKESPNLEQSIDQAKRSNSKNIDKGSHWDGINEDENPE